MFSNGVYHGPKPTMKTFVILHNIRSAHNVGSIFRTADGAGVTKIYLTGYTPAPVDRFGRPHEEVLKTSLGATDFVVWEQEENIESLLRNLREAKIAVVAVEQHNRSIDYRTYKLAGDTAFIFGNEIDGISPDICEKVDAVIEIPMLGKKESLNVSVTAGIILFSKI